MPSKAKRHLGTARATDRMGSLGMMIREISWIGKIDTLGLPYAFASHLQVKVKI